MKSEAYFIEGRQYSRTELLGFSNKKILDKSSPQWEKEIYHFILEWFNDSDSIIAQTSGSTGTPKKLKLPKAIMTQSALMTVEYFSLYTGSKIALLLPVNYIAGKMMIVRALVNQLDLYPLNPKGNVLGQLPEIQFHFTAMVPLQAENTLENPAHWKKIKKCLLGGAPVSETLKQKLQKLPTTFYLSYGMTETMSHVAIKNISENQDFFEAMPGIKFRQDDRNCLKIYAPDLLGKPLQTNDIVDLKSDVLFEWLGRFDNIINSGGIKIVPELLESKLQKVIPYNFFITAKSDEKYGEIAVLFVEVSLKEFKALNFQKIFDTYLKLYERPKRIYRLEKFEVSKNGKILRTKTIQKLKRN